MGFFSFIGKAIGGVAKAALGIGSKVLPGPLGSVAKVAHSILSVKHGATPKMAPSGGFTPGIQTGRSRAGVYVPPGLPSILRGHRPNVRPISMSGGWGPQALRSSPVLPGGAIATPSGPTPPTAAPPPMSFGGRASGGPQRRRRKSSKSSTRRAGSRKKNTGRKLKFGSPAWRKKYMKRRRRAA